MADLYALRGKCGGLPGGADQRGDLRGGHAPVEECLDDELAELAGGGGDSDHGGSPVWNSGGNGAGNL
ncbi:hypothetical protein GCM10008961_35210 [Deinococcus knuensis]|uniref:Uncharacterized protein n=1 Tax=Deinococcus knuensis TaxID=1837380 RepID=A0ABQ2SVC7_9DEIO|nr:hypothetical protein GCM10008961_35210 [Deinococcus knuensis]